MIQPPSQQTIDEAVFLAGFYYNENALNPVSGLDSNRGRYLAMFLLRCVLRMPLKQVGEMFAVTPQCVSKALPRVVRRLDGDGTSPEDPPLRAYVDHLARRWGMEDQVKLPRTLGRSGAGDGKAGGSPVYRINRVYEQQ